MAQSIVEIGILCEVRQIARNKIRPWPSAFFPESLNHQLDEQVLIGWSVQVLFTSFNLHLTNVAYHTSQKFREPQHPILVTEGATPNLYKNQAHAGPAILFRRPHQNQPPAEYAPCLSEVNCFEYLENEVKYHYLESNSYID